MTLVFEEFPGLGCAFLWLGVPPTPPPLPMESYNMTTVLKRLEAAASRLEDMVMFSERQQLTSLNDASAPLQGNGFREGSDLVSPRSSLHPAKDPAPLLSSAPATQQDAKSYASAPESAGIAALTSIKTAQLASFVDLSAQVGESVHKQAQAVASAYGAMLDVVHEATQRSKPEMEAFVALLQPMNSEAGKVESLRDEFRGEKALTNYFATVTAGVAALGWVAIEGKQQAAGYIQEMRDSTQFYANRALKDHKDAQPWVKSFVSFLEALHSAVCTNYPEGLKWTVSSAPNAPVSGGAPPPPPPPPSVSQLTANILSKSASQPQGGLSGVFAELNQGESIASGLRKTDKKALKEIKPPVSRSAKPKLATFTPASSKKLFPRVELVESKWHVEDLEDRHDVEISASMGQSVQIDNCRNCTIKIIGKAATFNLSRSDHVGLLVETMVASCDIVNSADFGLQVTGTMPSLMLDQCSQGSIYLSEESLGVDLYTSQTTAINVNIPEEEPGAYREVPLGEQILHNIVNGNIRSSVVKHG